MNTYRRFYRRAAAASILLALGGAALLGAPRVAAQASAACDGAQGQCVVSSSEQLSLAPGQTISRVLACPDETPSLFDSAYTTSNASVIVTKAASDGGQAANFTAINRSNALSFVTFHAGCVP
ncbi:MAG TPA: hypothetical protein VII06_30720 [Chloroflexota bacterium]